MTILIVIIAAVLMYVFEALHDYNVILDSKGVTEYNRKWHAFDLVFHIINAALLAYLCDEWLVAPIVGLIRITVFQNGLNVLRGKPFFYLGTNGIDGFIGRIFGKAGGVVIFFVSVTVLVMALMKVYNVF